MAAALSRLPIGAVVFGNSINENEDKGCRDFGFITRSLLETGIEVITEMHFTGDALDTSLDFMLPMLKSLDNISFAVICNLARTILNEIGGEEVYRAMDNFRDKIFAARRESIVSPYIKAIFKLLAQNRSILGKEATEATYTIALITIFGSAYSLGITAKSFQSVNKLIRKTKPINYKDLLSPFGEVDYDLLGARQMKNDTK